MSNGTFASLVGTRIRDKSTDYGVVEQIIELAQDNETFLVAVLSSGKGMRLSTISKLFWQQKKYLRRNSAGEIIVIAYPDDYDYSYRKFGPQRKRIVIPAVVGNIDNTAIVGDEKINITSHVSTGNPIYYNKNKMGEK